MAEFVRIAREGALATVTIDRPKALNALNPQVMAELLAAFREIGADESIRVVILTGEGERAFIAGADIAGMATMSQAAAREFMQAGHDLCNAIENGPQVVIGAVNGYALGGGCEVAMACDVRIASDRCRIGLPEVTLGIMPGWGGTQRLPQIVGKGIAKQLIFSGEAVDAETALRVGLVNQVVPAADLLAAARAYADKVLANGPLAIRSAKAAIHRGYEIAMSSALEAELNAEVDLFETADQREGMAAFVEKRKPVYTGR